MLLPCVTACVSLLWPLTIAVAALIYLAVRPATLTTARRG